MKNIKFIALAFAVLFTTASLASCSQTKEERDAEKLVKYVKDDKEEKAREFVNKLERKYKDEDDAIEFFKALEKEAASEDVLLKTIMLFD